MGQPVKVLYINGNIMKRGGIESFMMNYYRRIDPSEVRIDFLVHGYEKGEFDDEIISAGSKIIHVPQKSKHPLKYRKELNRIFSSGKYQVVHSHCDAMSGWILKVAANKEIPIRIAHSHNTAILTHNKLKLCINRYYKNQIPKYSTDMFACSKAAGEWMFGKKNSFEVIPNAIEADKFKFNLEFRVKIREEFNCKNNYVVGHIGRFDYQKNHAFILKIWKEVVKVKKNWKLMLVGGGDLKSEIEKMIMDYGLKDSVILTGIQENTAAFYSAFDIFVLPSHFEGLPVVAVEAQANGLKCLLSSNITKEVCLTSLVEQIGVDDADIWVERLMDEESLPQRKENSDQAIKEISKKGYEIIEAADKLKQFYVDSFQERRTI